MADARVTTIEAFVDSWNRQDLESALQLMRWLAAHITSPREHATPDDDARERARMLLVLRDATELVHDCQRDLHSRTPTRELQSTR